LIVFLNGINVLFFIMQTHCVYCEVKSEYLCITLTSVSQPPGPGINYTGPREALGNYNMLQDFISPVDN